ncbi:hypothetical protein EB796_020117 [Bugula neritina]|uniref:Core Histone H2A/H2B/H3 domain-containing protein n=1 Tax=Bugula neritina TaxID=10212 RepID=A0A7J7J6C2_BUGNE|nr:hypothetical protein EB796_020117 [Bugula neritina]
MITSTSIFLPKLAQKVPKKQERLKYPNLVVRKKKKRKESYRMYIYKVFKQVHPDTGVSSNTMSIMNSFVKDVFERIAGEA